jgi:hypothetical protein
MHRKEKFLCSSSQIRAAFGLLFFSFGLLEIVAGAGLDGWGGEVDVRPVAKATDRHVIHSYYLTCPESPDGTKLLYYTSRSPDGEHGDLIVQERVTGRETILVRDIDTADAHRVACQQWVSNGTKVAYHDVKNDHWSVYIVDIATGETRVFAENRLLGFGEQKLDMVPMYGCDWHPGDHRDLEILNVLTGSIEKVISIQAVEKEYGPWLQKEFQGLPTSIFFPILSPDGKRVFFKMAAPGPRGQLGDFRSPLSSHRQGTIVADMTSRQFLFMRPVWGHPAWHPDSTHILEVHSELFDVLTCQSHRIAGLPDLPGEHPSMSPDGKLFVIDGPLGKLAHVPGEWGVIVCDVTGADFRIIHRFDNSHGATSWRSNHPHPVFSSDGRRIYFNVNAEKFTQLFVAEINPQISRP